MKTEKQIKKEVLNDIEWGMKILETEKAVNHLYIFAGVQSVVIFIIILFL